jgi:hypothetical protein
MPESSHRAPQVAPKSERIVGLLAACIRAGVRLRYSQDITQGDSIDLARVHDLRSAMKAISEKLEVHQNLPSRRERLVLAITEAKLITAAGGGVGSIIDIREASVATCGSSRAASSQSQIALVALRQVQRDARAWAREYSRFMAEIAKLHKSASAEIDALRLPASTRSKARAELEALLLGSIARADCVSMPDSP